MIRVPRAEETARRWAKGMHNTPPYPVNTVVGGQEAGGVRKDANTAVATFPALKELSCQLNLDSDKSVSWGV
jgi:hypothetical protein